jgi:hypothetical protein
MTKLKKVLFAALLTLAAVLSTPKDSLASPCSICENSADCVACCRCSGSGSLAQCTLWCNGG